MQLSPKVLAVAVIVVGALVAGAYQMGVRRADQAAAPEGAPAGKAGPLAPGAAVPSGHPPMAAQAPSQDAPPVQGKVSGVDPNAKFTHFRVGNSNVKDILVDGEQVWVGTSKGVIRYNPATDEYRLYDNRSGLLSNGIFHVGKLDGRVVVGTYGGGMALFDETQGKWDIFNIPDGLGDAFVYDVLKTKSGDVWIATWSGVNRVRGGDLRDRSKWELHTVESTGGGLPNDWVYGLAEGRNGDVWLATEGGLALFRDGKWQNWNHAKGLGADYELVKSDLQFNSDPAKVSSHHARQKEEMGLQNVDVAYNPNYIVALVVDRNGVVWCGTWGGGLARYDGKQWRNYTVKDGLPGNHVFMLQQDPSGALWVGTNSGLTRMEGDKFQPAITVADGLFSNAVFSMALGSKGDKWVGSYGGVSHLYAPK